MCRWLGWSETEYLDASVALCDLALAVRLVEIDKQKAVT